MALTLIYKTLEQTFVGWHIEFEHKISDDFDLDFKHHHK